MNDHYAAVAAQDFTHRCADFDGTCCREVVEPGTRRIIHDAGWTITQIAQADGTWWNFKVERTAK